MNWKRAASASIVAVPIILLLGYGMTRDPKEIPSPLPGREAPAFSLAVFAEGVGAQRRVVGDTVRLAEHAGEVVVLNFWASWCDPCRDEAPLLQALADRQARNGVVVLGVDIQDGSDAAKKFLRTYGVTYPSLRDRNDDTKNAYAATGVPETFVIDKAGRVAFIHRSTLAADQLDELDRIVAGVAREKTTPEM